MPLGSGMDEECVVPTHNGLPLGRATECGHATCSHMDGPNDDQTKGSPSDRGRQMLSDITYTWSLEQDTRELIDETDSAIENSLAVPKGERGRGGMN